MLDNIKAIAAILAAGLTLTILLGGIVTLALLAIKLALNASY